jgi:hypothetical protein
VSGFAAGLRRPEKYTPPFLPLASDKRKLEHLPESLVENADFEWLIYFSKI